MHTLIVLCHLRWDFVCQRPQHLLTRLSQFYNVVVIEEPVFNDKSESAVDFLKIMRPADNITVYQPHTSVSEFGFHDEQLAAMRPLLQNLIADGSPQVVWFYTPMALPLLDCFNAEAIVYDCMDELSAFNNPPPQLLEREAVLLKIADLVFTGGPSLYKAKRDRAKSVHCFSSSVDVAHFKRALNRSEPHEALANIPGPRLGFYGVIDERFDLELIKTLADLKPDWQIILIGPVVKIDPVTLPQRANIHYLGQRTYDELPLLLAGWDVCLLPFALNAATKFISPTKVLEYMAAELPIVSTKITDVYEPYGHVVQIADDAISFVECCHRALDMTVPEKREMVAKMRIVLSRTSWDKTSKEMQVLIEASLA